MSASMYRSERQNITIHTDRGLEAARKLVRDAMGRVPGDFREIPASERPDEVTFQRPKNTRRMRRHGNTG